MQCTWCEEDIEEGYENEYKDRDGDPLCSQCWRDNFQFRCCLCGEYDLNEHRDVLLAVTRRQNGVASGVYKILDSEPYYTDGVLEVWLNPDAIERLCELPDGVHSRGYPCGHFCRACQGKVLGKGVWVGVRTQGDLQGDCK